MLFAGAIELSTEEVLLIVAVVATIALAVTLLGALTAWWLSRRAAALPLGAVAVWTGTILVGGQFGAAVGLAAGWLASAAVGFALATADGGAPDDRR